VYEAEEYPEELVLQRLKKQIKQGDTELEYKDYFGDESDTGE